MSHEKRFVDTVEKIYALATSDDDWESGLKSISDLLGAAGVSFEVINKRLKCPSFLRLGGDFDRDLSPEYLHYYSSISPRVRCAANYAAGDISFDYQILTEQEINHDEYYNDFAMPQGHRYFVAGHLLNDSSHIALFAAQRSPKQGHVDDTEIALVRRLLPHVRQALSLKFRLAETQVKENYLEYLDSIPEAVVGLNAGGIAVFENRRAELMFSEKDGVDCQQGNLMFHEKQTSVSFDRALQSLSYSEGNRIDTSSRKFVIRRPSNKKPYLATMHAIAKTDELAFVNGSQIAALLFIRDPELFDALDTDALQLSFQLSPQELELACALDRGASLKDIAKDRGVAITTVRSQLYSLMDKMRLNKQTDLVRFLGQYRRPFH